MLVLTLACSVGLPRGVARIFSVGGGGGGVEANDYRQNLPPINDKIKCPNIYKFNPINPGPKANFFFPMDYL